MNESNVVEGIPMGIPIRHRSPNLSAWCIPALGVTAVLGLLGCAALLNSKNPENEAVGNSLLKGAKVASDVANTVCKC